MARARGRTHHVGDNVHAAMLPALQLGHLGFLPDASVITAISMAIAKLEQQSELRLFDRQDRNVRLTPEGEVLSPLMCRGC